MSIFSTLLGNISARSSSRVDFAQHHTPPTSNAPVRAALGLGARAALGLGHEQRRPRPLYLASSRRVWLRRRFPRLILKRSSRRSKGKAARI